MNMLEGAQYVMTHPGGGWCVRKHGSRRATKRFSDKTDAEAWARSLAKRQGVTLYVHDEAGVVTKRELNKARES